MKNILQHDLYLCKKFQVDRIKFGIMVSKIVKISDFEKRGSHDFVGRMEKRRLHAAKFEIHVKYGVTLDGHNSFSFDDRKNLKVSSETLKCEEKV